MIDINKKYRTRDGREVRIYATDGAECLSVHGAIKWVTGKGWVPDIAGWRPCSWTKNGKAVDGEEFSCDLGKKRFSGPKILILKLNLTILLERCNPTNHDFFQAFGLLLHAYSIIG
jgi:hypothetical protein